MKKNFSYFFIIIYILLPIIGSFFPNIVGIGYVFFLFLYLLITIGTVISINYLSYKSLVRMLIYIFCTIVQFCLRSLWLNDNFEFDKYFGYFFILILVYFLTSSVIIPILENFKNKDFNKNLKKSLDKEYKKEIYLKYKEKLEKLPKLAWGDKSLSGYLFAKMVKVMDAEIIKSKPDYFCSFQNHNYKELFKSFLINLEVNFPGSSNSISIMEKKISTFTIFKKQIKTFFQKEKNSDYENFDDYGFTEGMNFDENEFDNFLDVITKNYSQHPDRIDRSNMAPQITDIAKQGIRLTKYGAMMYLNEKKLKDKFQDLKHLLNEKQISEREYINLKKSTLEKFIDSNNKDVSYLRYKLIELENLKDEKIISDDEFSDLREIIMKQYS